MEETPRFGGRVEELPFIAYYLLVSLKRDKALFTEYSPTFDDAFISSMQDQKELVGNLVSPQTVTGSMKAITKLVDADYKNIRNMLNRVDVYLNRPGITLTMAAADFGVQKVRKQVDSENDEGTVKELKTLYKNLEDNKAALEPVGYTAQVGTKFKDMIDSLSSNSQNQKTTKDSRIALTQANIKAMNKLWDMMAQVMDSGKTIAKENDDSAMLKDYTYTHLEKKVRQEIKTTASTTTTPPAQA